MQFLLIEIIFNLHPPIPEVCSIKLLNSWRLAFFSGYHFYFNLALIPLLGSQMILSTILAIQNNNHTQKKKKKKTNIYVENPFSLKGKITGQTPNNFTIIKSITIILMYVSRLKKKNSFVFLYSHTHKLSLSKAATLCTLRSIFYFTHNSLSRLSSFSKQLPLGCSLNSLVCSSFLATHACLLYKSMPSHS